MSVRVRRYRASALLPGSPARYLSRAAAVRRESYAGRTGSSWAREGLDGPASEVLALVMQFSPATTRTGSPIHGASGDRPFLVHSVRHAATERLGMGWGRLPQGRRRRGPNGLVAGERQCRMTRPQQALSLADLYGTNRLAVV